MGSRLTGIAAASIGLVLAGCVSLGLGGGDETPNAAEVPTDTYDNCGVSLGGETLLSSGSGGAVRLGMTECQLINALGRPSTVASDPFGGPQRRVTMTYASPDGTATSYVFVDNALKEINLVERGVAPPPG